MTIPFIGMCSGGPLDRQLMARKEAVMDVFAPKYPVGLRDSDPLPLDEFEVEVAGRYEYFGYGLWTWMAS